MVIRVTGDTIALTPPLIATENEIARSSARSAGVIEAVK